MYGDGQRLGDDRPYPYSMYAYASAGTISPTAFAYWMNGVGLANVKIRDNGVLRFDMAVAEAGSTRWSPTPAPSNCFWDRVTKAYYVQTHGTGGFEIVGR